MKRKIPLKASPRSFIVSDPTGEMQRQIAEYIEAHPRTVNSVTAKSDVIALALDLLMKQEERKNG